MLHAVDLIRLENSFTGGALGALRIGKKVFCATLEPPGQDNQPNMSCIPPGQYHCHRITSPRFGNTFEVFYVPGRNNILFHPGNKVEDTEGCICLGRTWGQLSGDRAVLNSGHTFDRFLSLLDSVDEFILTITEVY